MLMYARSSLPLCRLPTHLVFRARLPPLLSGLDVGIQQCPMWSVEALILITALLLVFKSAFEGVWLFYRRA